MSTLERPHHPLDVAPGNPTGGGPAAQARPRPSLARRCWASPSALAGSLVVGGVVLVALVSFAWTPHDPLAQSLGDALRGPSLGHLLGTDEYGRDELSRLMAGARISLFAGILAVLVASLVGIPAGLVAAARGGAVDELLMRAADVLFAFPALLAAIVLVTALGPSTATAMLAIGIASVPHFARVTRSAALPVLRSEYVAAARTYGRTGPAVVRRHVLPNVLPVLVVQTTLLFSVAIVAEASLSYLGLGTAPPAPSWGLMLKDGQSFLAGDPALVLWPTLAIALTVLGLHLLGEGLRDVLDPPLRPRA